MQASVQTQNPVQCQDWNFLSYILTLEGTGTYFQKEEENKKNHHSEHAKREPIQVHATKIVENIYIWLPVDYHLKPVESP